MNPHKIGNLFPEMCTTVHAIKPSHKIRAENQNTGGNSSHSHIILSTKNKGPIVYSSFGQLVISLSCHFLYKKNNGPYIFTTKIVSSFDREFVKSNIQSRVYKGVHNFFLNIDTSPVC